MEQTLPPNVMNHYRHNESTYDSISAQLEETKEQFLSASRATQIRMLQQSHSFAVISVQTPVEIHESAFSQLWATDSPSQELDDALASVNYRNQKSEYIRHSLRNGHKWSDVADLLEEGNIDSAHKMILDEFKGVGPAKAPFTLSMLGFTEKMCVDANIINAMGLDGHVSTVVVEKYDSICDNLRAKMPSLREMVSPFLWQWITFDYQRGTISDHEVFFEVVQYSDE
jgi:thermostable 8-oxoguanine DNA glycosylase